MINITPLKQQVIDEALITVRKEMKNMEHTGYERRMFLMVEAALAGGESAFAELMLRNFIGKFDLANTLTWINNSPKRKGNIWES